MHRHRKSQLILPSVYLLPSFIILNVSVGRSFSSVTVRLASDRCCHESISSEADVSITAMQIRCS